MGKYEHLPVYRAGYDMFIKMSQIIGHFPREHKFSIGERLQDAGLDLVLLIYKANATYEKVPVLKELLEKSQLINLLSRMCMDLKIMSNAEYCSMIEMNSEVYKQAQGWLKSQEKIESARVAV